MDDILETAVEGKDHRAGELLVEGKPVADIAVCKRCGATFTIEAGEDDFELHSDRDCEELKCCEKPLVVWWI